MCVETNDYGSLKESYSRALRRTIGLYDFPASYEVPQIPLELNLPLCCFSSQAILKISTLFLKISYQIYEIDSRIGIDILLLDS